MASPITPSIGSKVPGIAPCDGWLLLSYPEEDGDGFTTTGYVASRDDAVCVLCVCRFSFAPTQERFDWLVRNDFPPSPNGGPWTSAKIDWAINGLKAVA